MTRRLWRFFWSPSGVLSLGTLLIAGSLGGILFWGGLHWTIELTNGESFCIGCHEMRDTVYVEYQQSVHCRNASGVGAICSVCHVPKSWLPKMIRKVRAPNELPHHLLGTIDTPELSEANRAEMAQHVWATMKANDSLECRNCNRIEHIDFALMEAEAARQIQEGPAAGDTCIDCHEGIAHKLPDLSGGHMKLFNELLASAARGAGAGETLYPLITIPYYASAEDAQAEATDVGIEVVRFV